MLKIKDLSANIDNKDILNGLNLEIKAGEVHAIMGPKWIRQKHTIKRVLSGKQGYEL